MDKNAKPLIHVADLFRPHGDPDDHWDLATAYALASSGDLDLLGVLVDNPQNIEAMPDRQKALNDWADGGKYVARSPDAAAVAQLNYITHRAVPVATGTIWPTKPGEKVSGDNLPTDLRGVNMILEALRRSAQPVAILIGGSSQDVAIAGKKEPKLFAEKCAGIYLNAGIGSQNPEEQIVDGLAECNVSYNPGAYAAIFELPCSVFWMPCATSFADAGARLSDGGAWGTFWSFRQRDVLPELSNNLKAFFAYALSRESGTNWLSYLFDSSSQNKAMEFLDEVRGMYCLAGFLRAAGKTVDLEGQVVPLHAAGESAVYEFVPITARCSDSGITQWQRSAVSTNRYIFHVKDESKYGKAMVRALKSILQTLV